MRELLYFVGLLIWLVLSILALKYCDTGPPMNDRIIDEIQESGQPK